MTAGTGLRATGLTAAALGVAALHFASPAVPARPAAARRELGDEVRARMDAIDRACVRDPESLSDFLASEPALPVEALRAKIRLLADHRIRSRATEVKEIVELGPSVAVYGVVRQVVTRRAKDGAPEGFFAKRREDPVVYFFRRVDGDLRLARFESWSPEEQNWLSWKEITCASCAWRIPRPSDWFVVPHQTQMGNAFDSVSFVHPSLAASADFDCLTTVRGGGAMEIALEDNVRLAQKLNLPASTIVEISRRESTKGDVERADLAVEFREAGVGDRTVRAERSYLRLGPFLYTFVLHGEPPAVEAARASANRILDSLVLEAPDMGSVLKWHGAGGRLEGNRYVDHRYGVVFDGPAGWSVTRIPGLGRFRLLYRPPDDPKVGLHVCALENDGVGAMDEETLERLFETREGLLPKELLPDRKTERREVSLHPNRIDAAYEIETSWTEGGGPMRELLVAIPNGRMLYVLVAHAPQAAFDKRLPEFRAAIGSFRHQP